MAKGSKASSLQGGEGEIKIEDVGSSALEPTVAGSDQGEVIPPDPAAVVPPAEEPPVVPPVEEPPVEEVPAITGISSEEQARKHLRDNYIVPEGVKVILVLQDGNCFYDENMSSGMNHAGRFNLLTFQIENGTQ